MVGDALEISIIVSMVVLVAYPSGVMVSRALQARRRRHPRPGGRSERRDSGA